MITADLVLFGIRSALELGTQLRAQYVGSIQDRAILLPLPNVNLQITPENAITFYQLDGFAYVSDSLLLQRFEEALRLKRAAREITDQLEPEERELLLEIYEDDHHRYRLEQGLESPPGGISQEALAALLKVRQWSRSDTPDRKSVV